MFTCEHTRFNVVAEFPEPKGNGFTNCRLIVKSLIPCYVNLLGVHGFSICKRCEQLTGAFSR